MLIAYCPAGRRSEKLTEMFLHDMAAIQVAVI